MTACALSATGTGGVHGEFGSDAHRLRLAGHLSREHRQRAARSCSTRTSRSPTPTTISTAARWRLGPARRRHRLDPQPGHGAGEIGVCRRRCHLRRRRRSALSPAAPAATLTVTFNAAATSAAIEALIENLTYANSSDAPTASRTLRSRSPTPPAPAAIAPPRFAEQTGAANPFAGVDVGFLSKPASPTSTATATSTPSSGNLRHAALFPEHRHGLAPAFTERTGAANPFDGIDVGPIQPRPFADLDGDGDLDAVVGDSRRHARYFQNTGTAPRRPSPSRPAPPIPSTASMWALAHAGLADLDGDGDLDAVVGEYDGTLRYFKNTGTAPRRPSPSRPAPPTRSTASMWASSARRLRRPRRRRRPRRGRRGDDGTLHYFQNTGTAHAPAFAEHTGAANPFDGVDVGDHQHARASPTSTATATSTPLVGRSRRQLCTTSRTPGRRPPRPSPSRPAPPTRSTASTSALQRARRLGDLDGDGDLDAVVGGDDRHAALLPEHGHGDAPAFAQHTGAANPFDGVDVGVSQPPRLADLDGDGDLDAVVGDSTARSLLREHGDGDRAGVRAQTGAPIPSSGIDVGIHSTPAPSRTSTATATSTPSSGGDDGTLAYFQNTGTATRAGLRRADRRRQPLRRSRRRRLSLERRRLGDVDGDGDLDALVGELNGTLRYFQNTGTATSPAYAAADRRRQPLRRHRRRRLRTPALGDVDGDGDLDALVGEHDGTLRYFQNTGTATARPTPSRPAPPTPSTASTSAIASAPAWGTWTATATSTPSWGKTTARCIYFKNTGTATSPAYVEQTGAANPSTASTSASRTARRAWGTWTATATSTPSWGKTTARCATSRTRGRRPRRPTPSRPAPPTPSTASTSARSSRRRWGTWTATATSTPSWGTDDGTLRYFKNTGAARRPGLRRADRRRQPLRRLRRRQLTRRRRWGTWTATATSTPSWGSTTAARLLPEHGDGDQPGLRAQTGAANPFDGIDVGDVPRRRLGDVDGDGDLDALVGDSDGTLRYFKNTGTATARPTPADRRRQPLRRLRRRRRCARRLGGRGRRRRPRRPRGGEQRHAAYFKNTGTATSPGLRRADRRRQPLQRHRRRLLRTPALGDVDGDGDLDALVGDRRSERFREHRRGLRADGRRDG